jgi:hypothetical protein
MVTLGCARSLEMRSLESIGSLHGKTYEAYLYNFGNRLKAVFLKSHDALVEIVPYSKQISTYQMTFNDALSFMRGIRHKRIKVRSVHFEGRTIGYILTSPTFHLFRRDTIDVQFFERDGKVYFSVREIILSTD